jgi:hypothetical protein
MSEDATRERMTVGATELLRPIISAWCNDEGVAPQAFNLSSADKQDLNRLSVVRGDATSPDQAYADRASHIKKRCAENGKAYAPPVGVLAVTVGEVESVEIKPSEGGRTPLTVWDDSMNADRPDDHGHIDFNEVPPDDRLACRFVAKAMLAQAEARGWKFRTPEPSE